MRFSSDRRVTKIRRRLSQVKAEQTAKPELDAPIPDTPPATEVEKPLGQDAEENVLEAAARLFARKGVTHTTLRDIAHTAEMDYEALRKAYRWKEAILERLLAGPIEASVSELERIDRTDMSPAAKLYRAIFKDALQLSTAPEHLKIVLRLPESRQSEFESVSKLRAERLGAYERILEQGLDRGDFRPIHSGFTASLLDGLTDAAVTTSRDFDTILPAAQANRIAEFALRGLLNSPRRLPAIRDEAGVI